MEKKQFIVNDPRVGTILVWIDEKTGQLRIAGEVGPQYLHALKTALHRALMMNPMNDAPPNENGGER